MHFDIFDTHVFVRSLWQVIVRKPIVELLLSSFLLGFFPLSHAVSFHSNLGKVSMLSLSQLDGQVLMDKVHGVLEFSSLL
jgi:hypothetical protein